MASPNTHASSLDEKADQFQQVELVEDPDAGLSEEERAKIVEPRICICGVSKLISGVFRTAIWYESWIYD